MRILAVICSALVLVACQSVSPSTKRKYQEGVAAWRQGNQRESIRLLKSAIAESPKFYEAHLTLGQYHCLRRENDQAIDVLTKAVALQGNDPEGRLWLGKAHVQKGQFLKGQYQYSQVLKMDPGRDHAFRAYLGKGICKLKLTLIEDAAEYIQKALSIKSDDPDAIFYNALLKEAQIGPNKQSMQAYERVLTAVPDHLGALRQIGDTWKDLGHHQKAAKYYEKFLQSGGEETEVRGYLQERRKIAQQQPQQPENQEERMMACPECERIGRKGQMTCDFDGSPLEPGNGE